MMALARSVPGSSFQAQEVQSSRATGFPVFLRYANHASTRSIRLPT